jgi:hypothetical protein
MAMQNYTINPAGKIHEMHISDKEMYALEPLLLDNIELYNNRIADLRKDLAFLFNTPCKEVLSKLAEIQALEGKITILKDLSDQLDLL